MPMYRGLDHSTGQSFVFSWDSPRPPTEADIEREWQKTQPPVGMEPRIGASQGPLQISPQQRKQTEMGLAAGLPTQPSIAESTLGSVPQAVLTAADVAKRIGNTPVPAWFGLDPNQIDAPQLPSATNRNGLLGVSDVNRARANGFIRGEYEALTSPIGAATLGKGALAKIAGTALGMEGVDAATDDRRSGWERGLGVAQAIGGALPFLRRRPAGPAPPPVPPPGPGPTGPPSPPTGYFDAAINAGLEPRAPVQTPKAATAELIRDQRQLTAVEAWLQKRRAAAAAATDIENTRAGLTEQPPVVRQTRKSGEDSVTRVWVDEAAAEAKAAAKPARGGKPPARPADTTPGDPAKLAAIWQARFQGWLDAGVPEAQARLYAEQNVNPPLPQAHAAPPVVAPPVPAPSPATKAAKIAASSTLADEQQALYDRIHGADAEGDILDSGITNGKGALPAEPPPAAQPIKPRTSNRSAPVASALQSARLSAPLPPVGLADQTMADVRAGRMTGPVKPPFSTDTPEQAAAVQALVDAVPGAAGKPPVPPPSTGLMTPATLDRGAVDEILSRVFKRLGYDAPGRSGMRRTLGGLDAEARKGFEGVTPADKAAGTTISPAASFEQPLTTKPAKAGPGQSPEVRAAIDAAVGKAAEPPVDLKKIQQAREPAARPVTEIDETVAPVEPALEQTPLATPPKARGKKVPPVEPDAPPAPDMRPRIRKKPSPSGEGGFAVPSIAAPLVNRWGRAVAGGAIGASTGDSSDGTTTGTRLRNAAIGAALGGLSAAPFGAAGRADAIKFLKEWNRANYEGMLAGAPQLTNVIGNVGGLITAPIVEAARGSTGTAKSLLRAYVRPDTYRAAGRALKEGYRANTPLKVSGEMPLGPMGRSLNAVDAATKKILEQGGLDSALQELYTYSGRPSTQLGQKLAALQQVPGINLLSPFVRTAINQLEVGAALSPARAVSPALQKLVPYVQRGSKEASTLKQLAGPLSLLGPAAAYLGYTHDKRSPITTPTNPTKQAIYGALSAPYSVANNIRDYQAYGGGGIADLSRAALNQVPVLGDMARQAENPTKVLGQIAARPIPAALMAVGDRTVRKPETVNDYIAERIPAGLGLPNREQLGAKSDFLGTPLQRNVYGQVPVPQYETDPRAAKLSDLHLLKREQPASFSAGPMPGGKIGAALAEAKRVLGGEEGVDVSALLTPQQRSSFQQLKGQLIGQAVAQIMAQPQISGMNRMGQYAITRVAMQEASAAASKLFLAQHPELASTVFRGLTPEDIVMALSQDDQR